MQIPSIEYTPANFAETKGQVWGCEVEPVLTRPASREGDGRSGRAQENSRRLRPRANAFGRLASQAFRKLPMLPVIVLAGVILSATVDGYSSLTNVQNIMRQLSVILIAATGQTLVLLIGGIDLSVGAAIALAAVCGALAMHSTASRWSAC